MLFSWEVNSELSSFTETNCDYLVKKLDEYNFSIGIKKILINCNGVRDVHDHSLDALIKYQKENNLDIILFSNDRVHRITKYCNEHINGNEYAEKVDYSFYYMNVSKICSSEFNKLVDTVLNLENDKIKNLIGESFIPCPQVLSSTPLEASGQFNANELISNPNQFRWLILLLVEKISSVINQSSMSSYSIVASSLRGACIAGVVKEFLHFTHDVNFVLFDHLGPNHDLVDHPLNLKKTLRENCIYIGDFLIAGTELKITEAYCNFMSGNLKHAFVLGKYTKKSVLGNHVSLHSLVELRECVTNLEYRLD